MSASPIPLFAPAPPLWRWIGLECVLGKIEINLGVPVNPPIEESRPNWNWGPQTGIVTAHLRDDEELYINGELFRAHLEPDQAPPGILGRELYARYEQKPEMHVHVNVLAALAQAGLFPRSLRYPETGIHLLYAWGNGFVDRMDNQFVQGVVFDRGMSQVGAIHSLDEPWTRSRLAASVG